MTQPQSNQSLQAENALAISAAKSDSNGQSEAASPLRDVPSDRFPHRTTAESSTAKRSADSAVRFGAAKVERFGRSARRYRQPPLPRADEGFPKVNLLGVDFDNVSKLELLSRLKRGVIFTPNVDHLMKLRRDRNFASVYQTADYKVCDSQVLIYAAKFLGKPLKAKLSGSDLFPWFCDYHRDNDAVKIFLLGGLEGVAKEARRRINDRIGRQIVVGEYSPPYGFEQDPVECEKILAMLERSPANVVAVCLGAPKQENWIATYRESLPSIDIFMAIGATVDFEAGMKPRAPKFVSEIGLEWLYRLLCEPRRLWKRYLIDGLPFVGLVIVEKLRQLRWLR